MKSVKKILLFIFLLILPLFLSTCKKDLLKLVSVTTGTFTDSRDGKTYKTTTIANYTWLAENLDFATDSGSCYYNNDVQNKEYGRLYLSTALLSAVPAGWHLPTSAELKFLYDSLGCYDAAYQMKECGNKHWTGDNSYANNQSELTILPGGEYSFANHQFKELGIFAIFWETVQSTWFVTRYNKFYYNNHNATTGEMYSIRVVKDY